MALTSSELEPVLIRPSQGIRTKKTTTCYNRTAC